MVMRLFRRNSKPSPAEYAEPQRSVQVRLKSGLSIWRGTVTEEYLSQLKPWSRAAKVYRQMQDDIVIGTLLDSIKIPLMATTFEVQPRGDDQAAKDAKTFLEDNLFAMRDTDWREHVETMLEFLDFGFAIAEKVLEKKDDGRLYLRTLLPVGQETLERWGDLDEYGNVTEFYQRDPVSSKVLSASMDKVLHFRWRGRKQDPQGRSLLRPLYRAWYFKSNLEAIEAIGAERDVGNVPVLALGPGYYTDAQIDEFEKALEGLRMDEASYMIIPNGAEVRALGSGAKVYDVRRIIDDWQHLIRQRFFADFLSMTSSEAPGSQALARELTTFFGTALRGVQEAMLSVWNRQLIPWLFQQNRWEMPKYPVLEWIKPGAKSIQSMAQALNTLLGAGVLSLDVSVENYFRREIGLPPISEETWRVLQAQKAAARGTKGNGDGLGPEQTPLGTKVGSDAGPE